MAESNAIFGPKVAKVKLLQCLENQYVVFFIFYFLHDVAATQSNKIALNDFVGKNFV